MTRILFLGRMVQTGLRDSQFKHYQLTTTSPHSSEARRAAVKQKSMSSSGSLFTAVDGNSAP